MPSHFTSIGFPAETVEDIEALAVEVIDATITFNCPKGRYLRWAGGEGAELWLQMDEDYNLIGVTPFFQKKSVMNVGVTRQFRREGDTMLEGAIRGWVNPKHSNPQVGTFELVCEIVDIGRYPHLEVPFISPLRLSAFAYNVDAFSSFESFQASEVGQGKPNPEMFTPTGVRKPGEGVSLLPESSAEISGHVVETALLRNPHSQQKYQWILVRTDGGLVDMVCDPAIVTDPITEGGIVSAYCWLCAQILKPRVQQKKSFTQLLFGN
ncbi:hypothetical protein [Candidatus Nitronereus thalassa]|uniref:Uncharacterized protein n=1 Tax=Candidatus Nitronereus thalassa TaxID=3020898 RepID=A0ABU3K9V9_9BACT|nr:hypothetical protein [Candidatus Nitronereus thalassa]MDT7043088.1 hypothetical protein [Candidatus Nitronereus thalassa]